ncbi:MAG: M48 family metallopeptidase [bacterium]
MRNHYLKATSILTNSRGNIFEDLFQYVFGIAIIAVVAYFLLGYGVNTLVARIPVNVENRIFSNYGAPQSSQPVGANAANSESFAKLQNILEKLISNKEVPPLNYRLFIIDQESPNAVAMPGGGIGVTRGLISALKEEPALAFVLGHELGHFRYRDHLRGLGRIMAIRMIVAYFLGDSEIGSLIGTNALSLMDKKYSREQEEAADRFGVGLVFNSYGDVKGTTRLFEILEKSESSPKWAYMFSTHPATSARIAALKKYAGELKSAKETPVRNPVK